MEESDMTLDTSGVDDPEDYELKGGPFDGCVFRAGGALTGVGVPCELTLRFGARQERVAKYAYDVERNSGGEPECEVFRWVPT